MSESEQDYEDRDWYVSTADGQRGYLVDLDGEPHIRLDRGETSPVEKFVPGRWLPEKEQDRELLPVQKARVLHAADTALAIVLNDHAYQTRPWDRLSSEEQREVYDKPPPGRKERVQAWAYLKRGLDKKANKEG